MGKVIIIMGSKSDKEWADMIASELTEFGIDSVLRIASAHKTPIKCYEIIKDYENEKVVFITIAGYSNALSGFVDGQVTQPVIACPPYIEKYSGIDIFSSLRMPSGVAPMVILDPKNAALAAAKILGLTDEKINNRIINYKKQIRNIIENDDMEINHG